MDLKVIRQKVRELPWDSSWFLVVYSIFIGLFIGGLVLWSMGYGFLQIYSTLCYGMIGKPTYILQIIIRATPVIITGLAFLFAFKTGLFNIGVEGQFMMGAILANIIGAHFHLPFYIHIPLALIAGILGGAFFAFITGVLKAIYNVHEVISAIMLNWVGFYLTNYIISLPFMKRENSEYAVSIASSASLSLLKDWKISEEGISWRQEHAFWNDILKNHLNYGIFFAIAIAFLVFFLLERTTLGYRLKAVGKSPRAACYLGINVNLNMILSLSISGAIAGLAGALQVMGVDFAIYKLLVPRGYGFDGIAVSFLALGNPIGAIFSGIFYSALQVGGDRLQIIYGIPLHAINLMIGVIIFFAGMPYFFQCVIKKIKVSSKQKEIVSVE